MESNDISELLQALRQETEPDSRVLWRLVRNPANLHDISVLNEAMRLALKRDFWTSVRILLEAGASPNTRMLAYAETSLHICSENEQGTELVRELLNYGADVNAEDDEQRTPLHYASRNHCVENMQELLKNGATVDAVDEEHETPLIMLMYSLPHISVVQVLLSAGADVNFRDDRGWTILHHAMGLQPPPIVRLLLRYNGDANIRNNNGDTPLHRAVCERPEPQEVIRELLKGGARLNELNSKGHSSLRCAVHFLDEEATQELLHWGAAFEIVECLEALVVSATKASDGIAKELIRYAFIKDPYNLESIRQQLMQEGVINILRNHSSPECNLEDFKHSCLAEVEALSNSSCDCTKSSIWGSINNSEKCTCDTHQAILKFLFSRRISNFTEAFFYKLSKVFLLEVSLNLISYFQFKESEKLLILPWPCMKEIERHVSFVDVVSFVQRKQSEMDASEFEKFLAFIEKVSPDASSSEISPPIPKRLRVS